MKIILLICLASSLVSSEKLDRSYLPPPGSQFSGGRPGDIQVPFEFPKETYSTGRPSLVDKPDIELGINRRPAAPTGAPDNRHPGFSNFQNFVPTTTTSYAITQTTTFAPEEYDGLNQPSTFINGSNRIQPNVQGQTYQQPIGGSGQGPTIQYRPEQNQQVPSGSYGTTSRPGFPGAPEEYDGLNQPITFINGSNRVQPNSPGQTYQQPIGGSGQGPTIQYRPEQNQPLTFDNYGTTSRPGFPGTFKGPDYLPPASSPARPNSQLFSNSKNDLGYPAGQRTGPIYQDEQVLENASPGLPQNQYTSDLNTPISTGAPQYHDERFDFTGPAYQQNQKQFQGSQFPSTVAPQYQTGQKLPSSESIQQNHFLGNQNLPSSTVAPSYQTGQQFSTPGLSQQQFGSRVPNQQTQHTLNRNGPSSTSAPTPGSIQNFPSTVGPNNQIGQTVTTPDKIYGGLISVDQVFSSPVPGLNQYTGNQNFPSTTATPQSQSDKHLSTPGYVEEGYQYQVPTQQNQNLAGNQIFPTSTSPPQYQNGQKFATSGPIRQNQYPGNENFPSIGIPVYQDGQRFSTPGQYQSELVSDQQRFGSRIPSQQNQNQYTGNQNFPSSAGPQYQEGQRFTTPVNQYYPSSTTPTPDSSKFVGNQNFPSTAAANYQNGQRFTTPGQIQEGFVPEQQRFGNRVPNQQRFGTRVPNQQNQNEYQTGQRFTTPENQYLGSQGIPSSTTAPQYQGQRFTTPGQQGSSPNQPNYPGSTVAPQYQPTFASTPGTNQQGFNPTQQNQYNQHAYNQQVPSSTLAPGRFIPGSQTYGNDEIQNTPGSAGSFPEQQGALTGEDQIAPTYGNRQQTTSQPRLGFPSSAPFSNQVFSSTTAGSLPVRDFISTSGSAGRLERPQAEGDRNAEILNYENVLSPEGYYYRYDTSNGIHADETGTVGNGTRAQGGFSYTGDDGKVYSVFYSADENGFLPRGDHLPTPPPIPEAIQRVIDQASKDKELGIEDDGSYNEEKYGYMKYEGPFIKVRAQNKSVPTVNGADIPERTESRINKPNKKTTKLQGMKVTTEDVLESSNNDSETEPESDDINSNKNKDANKRIGTKRPKPIKNLTVEDSRPSKLKGNQMPTKSTISSMADSSKKTKDLGGDGSSHRPLSSEENVSSDFDSDDDNSEEQEDSEIVAKSEGIDYSDLINYKDDPNNRTDFHGLNKYLPKPKGANRKHQSSKKRPTAPVDGTRKITKIKQPGDRNSQTLQDNESDDEARTPPRKNQFGLNLSKTKSQPATDNENTYGDDDTRINVQYESGDKTKPVSIDHTDKIRTSQLNKKMPGRPKRPNVNQNIGIYDNTNEEPVYKTTVYSDDETNEKYNSDDETRPVASNRMGRPRISQSNKKMSVKPKRPTSNESIVNNEYTKPSSEEETEYAVFSDDEVGEDVEYDFGDKTRPITTDQMDKTKTSPSNKKASGKPKRPTINDGTSSAKETGYDYTPPQRKFESEGGIKFPTRTSQTTLRPFMTKNVYGDYNDQSDEVGDQYVVEPSRPSRPVYTQKQQYPGSNQGGDRYNENPKVDVNDNETFTSTRKPVYGPTSSRQPFVRPQTTAFPQYEGQRVTDGDRYNEPVGHQASQRPEDKQYYNTNAPNRGTSSTDAGVYGSTTPLPGSESYRKYGPGQYQDKPTGSANNDEMKEISINRPGNSQSISGQYPSTTYRPNYRRPANNPITVDGFGRPISNGPVSVDRFGRPTSTVAPAFDGTVKPASIRPLSDQLGPSQIGDNVGSSVGPFSGTTRGLGQQSSTSAPRGEDFTGPKQPQRFDPNSGYYYK